MLFMQRKTYTDYRKTYQSSMLMQDVPFLKNFNHKTHLSYIQICNQPQIFRNKLKHVWLKIDAVEPYSEQKTYSRGIFCYRWIFFFNLQRGMGTQKILALKEVRSFHHGCQVYTWVDPVEKGLNLQPGLTSIGRVQEPGCGDPLSCMFCTTLLGLLG